MANGNKNHQYHVQYQCDWMMQVLYAAWVCECECECDCESEKLTWKCCTSWAAKRVQFSLYKIFKSSVIDHKRSTVLKIQKQK